MQKKSKLIFDDVWKITEK